MGGINSTTITLFPNITNLVQNNLDIINQESKNNKKCLPIKINQENSTKINNLKNIENLGNNMKKINLTENNMNSTKNSNIEIKKDNKIIISKNQLKKKSNHIDSNNIKDTIPYNLNIFNDLNIFNSTLLLLAYNSFIKKYLNKRKDKIISYGNNNPNCLISIIYYIYECLWISNPRKGKIKKEMTKEMYQNFLSNYSKVYYKNINGDLYFKNICNLEMILNFIYSKLNEELTEINKDHPYKNHIFNDNILTNYMIEFHGKNKSVISDSFNGFYQEISTCLNCKGIAEKINNIYMPNIKYSTFNYLYFNLDDIAISNKNNNIINSINTNYVNQNNYKINIYDCFNYQLNKLYQSSCNLCHCYNLNIIQKKYYFSPNVLTIIINNNNGNFIINNKINFYCIKCNYDYYLVGMICKLTYNDKLIVYNYNKIDNNWYYYDKSQIFNSYIVNRTTDLNINAIPYVLLYQKSESLKDKYSHINIEKANNKIGYTFNFINGLPQRKIFFDKDITVGEAKNEIKNYFKFKDIIFVINAKKPSDDEILKDVNIDNTPILVVWKNHSSF